MKDLASKACSIETFIVEHPRDIEVTPSEKPHVVHAHCHAKVELHVIGDALGRLGISEVSMLDSGCCGMAGSFGYMKATDELSRAIAENSLGEAMGSLDGATLVAAGTSCRHQIADCFGVQALHPAEVAWSAVALRS
jgi:Fe-S oxidoreductase